ncbi:MAG: two-component sensor histidine kinase, partial [Deltaproteobacteria bacterium]|nr:two-component sensor histidine kinase [Deltaproteobacteria bacterium]
SGYAWLLDSNNRSILVEPSGKIAGQSFEKAFLPGWPRLYGLAVGSREGRPGLDWYDFWDAGRPGRAARKLVGYAPVRIEGFLWTLGVCTPVGDVEKLLSSFLDRQQRFATTVMLAVLAGGAALLLLLATWNRSLTREVDARTRDLTDAREKLEAAFGELLSTKKVAAVGHLALGLAHEIRNPLSSIRMNMQMLRKRVPADGTSQESFAIMEEEILRLNRLLTEVMTFARPADLALRPTDLRETVEKVVRLLAHRLEEGSIAVRVPWDLDCPSVLCDAEQLHQVFLNLILNAVQALESVRGERRLTVRGRWKGDTVSVDISDTGPGVPPENVDHVFNPFFTTKAQGTGLGLSLLQRIVVRHGGWVELRSPPGEGATFTVHLPVNGPDDPQGNPT